MSLTELVGTRGLSEIESARSHVFLPMDGALAPIAQEPEVREVLIDSFRTVEELLNRPIEYARGSWVGILAYPEEERRLNTLVARQMMALFDVLYGDRRAVPEFESVQEEFFFYSLRGCTGSNADLYIPVETGEEAKALSDGLIDNTGSFSRAVELYPFGTGIGVELVELRPFYVQPFMSGIQLVFVPEDLRGTNMREQMTRRQEAMRARVVDDGQGYGLELTRENIAAVRGLDEVRFTRRDDLLEFMVQLARALRVNAIEPFRHKDQEYLLPETELEKVRKAHERLRDREGVFDRSRLGLVGEATANNLVAFFSAPAEFRNTVARLGDVLPHFDASLINPHELEQIVHHNGIENQGFNPFYTKGTFKNVADYLDGRGAMNGLTGSSEGVRMIERLWRALRRYKRYRELLVDPAELVRSEWDIPWQLMGEGDHDYVSLLMQAFSPVPVASL